MRLLLLASALLIMVFGVFAGCYIIIWWGWIGGIINVVEAFKATPIDSFDVAVGIIRVVFAGALGAISGWLIVSLGALVAALGDKL